MKAVFRDIALARKSQARAARLKLVRAKGLCKTDRLRGVAIITFQNAAEFALATNCTFGLRSEVCVENSVVSRMVKIFSRPATGWCSGTYVEVDSRVSDGLLLPPMLK
jgi:hypothetical protein